MELIYSKYVTVMNLKRKHRWVWKIAQMLIQIFQPGKLEKLKEILVTSSHFLFLLNGFFFFFGEEKK